MNRKELAEIKRRLDKDKGNIGVIRGCYVSAKGEVISAFRRPVGPMGEEELKQYYALFRKILSGVPGKTGIDVPERYYMVIVAQTADGVRALAVRLPQSSDRWAFPVHDIVTIDELEKETGLDFFPEMPSFLQRPLKADRPTRLWPIRFRDLLKLILLRFA